MDSNRRGEGLEMARPPDTIILLELHLNGGITVAIPLSLESVTDIVSRAKMERERQIKGLQRQGL
jgi:hypothetical protein